MLDDEPVDLVDQAFLLEHGNEAARGDHAVLRVVPACERLEAADLLRHCPDDGLVPHLEVPVLYRTVDMLHYVGVEPEFLGELFGIDVYKPAAVSADRIAGDLGAVEGDRGSHLFRPYRVDARLHAHGVPLAQVQRALVQLAAAVLDIVSAVEHGKLVGVEPRARFRLEDARHEAAEVVEQRVAGVLPIGLVEVPEAHDLEVADAAASVAALSVCLKAHEVVVAPHQVGAVVEAADGVEDQDIGTLVQDADVERIDLPIALVIHVHAAVDDVAARARLGDDLVITVSEVCRADRSPGRRLVGKLVPALARDQRAVVVARERAQFLERGAFRQPKKRGIGIDDAPRIILHGDDEDGKRDLVGAFYDRLY